MRLFALLLISTLTFSSCVPPAAWWDGLKDNPVQSTELILGTVSNIERVATLAFTQLKPFIPATQQADFQGKFDASILTLATAMQAVRSAVRAAADAKQEHPDLTKVIADVTKAVADLQSLISEAKNLATPLHMTVGSGPVQPLPAGVKTAVSLNTLVDDLKRTAQ